MSDTDPPTGDGYIYVIFESALVAHAEEAIKEATVLRVRALRNSDTRQANIWWYAQMSITFILHAGLKGVRKSELRRRIAYWVANTSDNIDGTVDEVMRHMDDKVKHLSDKRLEMLNGDNQLVIQCPSGRA